MKVTAGQWEISTQKDRKQAAKFFSTTLQKTMYICGPDKQHLHLNPSHHLVLSKVLSCRLSSSIHTKPRESVNMSEGYRGQILQQNGVNPAGKQARFRILHFSMDWGVTIEKEGFGCPDSTPFVPSFILAQWFSDHAVHKNYCSVIHTKLHIMYFIGNLKDLLG